MAAYTFEPRNGLEPRGGANLQYLAAWVQIGERRIGHIHGGAAVQVDHGVVVFGGNIHRRTHAPHACRIDQNADVRQFILQGVAQVLHIARAGQVKRQHPDGHGADGLQRFQPVAAAGVAQISSTLPCSAIWRTNSRPKPLEAPVTNAIFMQLSSIAGQVGSVLVAVSLEKNKAVRLVGKVIILGVLPQRRG